MMLLGLCLLARAALPAGSAQGADGREAGQALERIRVELDAAQRSQDHLRLQALYGELAALQPDNPEAHRGHGLSLFLGGRHEGAAAALRRAVALRPDLAGARLYLGISLYHTNRFREALGEINKSPELAVGQPVALHWQGACYRALGELAQAIAVLEAARGKAPSNADTLHLLVRSYLERSAQLMGELLADAPQSAFARLLRAQELLMDGIMQAALRELDSALESSPGMAGLHLTRGQILWAQEEYDLAAEEFRREISYDPLSAEARIRLAGYELDRGNTGSAREHLRFAELCGSDDDRMARLRAGTLHTAAVQQPQSPAESQVAPAQEGPLQRARILYARGDHASAAALLEELPASSPKSVEAARVLVRCHLAGKHTRRAAEQLSKILEFVPHDPESLYLAGKVYERLASETADALYASDPDSASVRLLRGEAFERGPRYEFQRALDEFSAAIETDPQNLSVHHAAGRVLFKMKRFDEAARHLRLVLSRNQHHGMANYLLGKIQLAEGRRADAIDHLSAAVAAQPGLADARRDLARALVLEGRHAAGIEIYKDLLGQHPTDSSLHALLAVAFRQAGSIDQAREHAEQARRLGSEKQRLGQK